MSRNTLPWIFCIFMAFFNYFLIDESPDVWLFGALFFAWMGDNKGANIVRPGYGVNNAPPGPRPAPPKGQGGIKNTHFK